MRSSTILAVAACLATLPVDAQQIWPSADWDDAKPAGAGMDAAQLERARDYALRGGGSGIVIRGGKCVIAWGDPDRRYDLKSTTKSIGLTALGLAIAEGKIALDDPAVKHHPTFAVPPESNRANGWIERITIHHLAAQTAGFRKPGGYMELDFAPGTKWLYSDGGPNWLAECVTLAYRRDLDELMFERVFTALGIARKDLVWRRNAYREHEIEGIARREFGAGILANVDAMARIGYLYLRDGVWRGERILPSSFVARVARTPATSVGLPEVDPKNHGNASDHYGLLWWNNADGTLERVPRDAYWSWGLYDSLILVIPSLDIVAARAGRSWPREPDAGHYEVLAPYFDAIVAAAGGGGAPYPPSPIIRGLSWAPAADIVRAARGSDNWPITWGDDDRLYTAYGDGRGFEPFVEQKLSLGLARIDGDPRDPRGVAIRAPTAERTGDGAKGPKASGMLMVHGVLYMLARNSANAQLAWSEDRGATWTWNDWRFETSFGCPTFLQFGRDYAGARDHFAYIYSQDSDSAYERADRMVLARVPIDRIRSRDAYEFFVSLDEGRPTWSADIAARGAVFASAGRCYRSSVSFNAGLRRYLWCQTGAGEDTRFRGGIAIYDAPEPWGPWTTVAWTGEWDVGPGETASFPTKWISADGRSLHLVFSGDDCFSVRAAELLILD